MNSIIEGYYPVFEQYQDVRRRLLELLEDEDLAFRVDGSPRLGELCKEIGEIEQAYIKSFKTFKINFDYRSEDPELASSVAKLKSWYSELDEALKATITSFSEEDLESKKIDRGGWEVSIQINLDIYKEALLIFYGKTWVYLHALGKTLPEQWREWIG